MCQEKAEHTPPIKIKNTEKNRGNFLANIPVEEKASASKKKSLDTSKQNQQQENQAPVLSRIDAFKQKHLFRVVTSATVENSICTSLKLRDIQRHKQ